MEYMKNGEEEYLKLMKNVIENGFQVPDRTGIGNRFLPGQCIKYDISDRTLPLFTSRKIPWKNVIHELLFFMKGKTDTKELESEKVYIWKQNTSNEFLKKRRLDIADGKRPAYEEGTMGPMYGFQWRHFGTEYTGPNSNYGGKGFDQLQSIIDNLKKNPFGRDHILSAFNPCALKDSVLCPCHFAVQWVVSPFISDSNLSSNYKKNVLHVIIYQRSADLCLGVPTNVASYATLTHILAHYTNMETGSLTHFMGHAHVYQNQIEVALENIQRIKHLKKHPKLKLVNMPESFEDLVPESFVVENYQPQPFLKYPFAT